MRTFIRTASFTGLGLIACAGSTASLFAQDTNNSSTLHLQTNAILHAPTGAYNNLSTGQLHFNGPAGAAKWSSHNLVITNAGLVSLLRGDLGIIGDFTNTGTFDVFQFAGRAEVDGHFTNSSGGELNINGEGLALIGDYGGGKANFTNAGEVSISSNSFISADLFTNNSGGSITNLGRIEGRDGIVNNATIDSEGVASILKGNVTNNGTINASNLIEGNVTNAASSTFNVTGNLLQTGNFTNAGTLDVDGGNLTGIDQLTNSSVLTIADNRTVSAQDIENNSGGSITLGENSILTGSTLENNSSISVGAGGTVRSTSTGEGEDLTNSVTGTISFNGETGTAYLSSGTGKIVNEGTISLNAGTVLVTGDLDGEGTFEIADGATFQTGSADQTIENEMTLDGVSTFDTNGFDATVSGDMSGEGGLTKVGQGDLVLEGTNSFSGATSIEEGQLTLKGGNALGDSNAVTVGEDATLMIHDDETIGSLEGEEDSEMELAADLRTGGNDEDATYSGKITGEGGLIKEGTGTMTLDGSNDNTFSGGVTVENGTLIASTDERLGNGTVIVGLDGDGAAGTLQIDEDTTQTIDGVEVESESGEDAARGILNNSGVLTSNSDISNSGTINNQLAASVINGGITNENEEGIINNEGTINGGVTNLEGEVNNDAATSVINGGLENLFGLTNNTGAINGGVFNSGTLNSDTATSVITGGLTNRGDANLRNKVSGAIVNEDQTDLDGPMGPGIITVTGNLVGNSTLLNKGTSKVHVKDGNFSGIATLTNESTDEAGVQIDETRTLSANAVTNRFGSTIANSGTLQSATAINNSGTITNDTDATVNGGINNAFAGALVTNDGTINGGITQNFGTVDSLDSDSVINGGVNNSAYVNAQGRISGAVVNNAQHSFTDLTLIHELANAAGTVTFGSGESAQTFDLFAESGDAVGAEGNGEKSVVINFDADESLAGTSSYDPESDTIYVYVEDEEFTTVEDIQDAIENGSGFTASGGTLDGVVVSEDSEGFTDALVGGRESGTALIRVMANETGSAAQNMEVTIVNDDSIDDDSAVASIDAETGDIVIKVNGEVDYDEIAEAIDDVAGFDASITTSMGDQQYVSTLDTPPPASTLTNGIFNVEGDLVVDSAFTNGGHLNLNEGDLTGITTFTNSGDVDVEDGYSLEAATVNNDSGEITLGHESTLFSNAATNNSAEINVHGEGDIASDGTITNHASGKITFGLGDTDEDDVSELYSDTNSIVNNGQIDLTEGVLLTTGNVSGNGTITLDDDTTFRTGNNHQTITNKIEVAGDSATFDTDGKNATVSGAVIGNGELIKSGAGNLTLSGTNTFTGPSVIEEGQLTLQGGHAIADNTAVQLNEGSLKVSSAETIGSLATSSETQTILDSNLTTGGNNSNSTSSGVIRGAAGLIKQGTGTMRLDHSAANIHAGGTTVSAGTIVAATSDQLGSGKVSVGSGASLTTGNNTTQSVAGLTNQGTVSIGDHATLNTGSDHFDNSGTVNVGTDGVISDVGSITNSGTINFSGGTATLSSGTNSITNTGNINLNAGTVLVKGNLAGTGSFNMNNGTTLRSGSANQQIANGISVNTGTAVIDTNGNNVNLTGTITGSGSLNKVGTGELTWVGVNNGDALIDSGVMITSTQNQVGNIQTTSGSGVVFDQSTNGDYSGSVTGDGFLTKSGTGIVTMTGNSVYSGGTTVLDGTLRVGKQGTGQLRSNVNVHNKGRLGGGGTIVGNVRTQRGGRIAPGNSIGTLNITGDLDATGSTIENEMNGTTGDLVNVTGTATISGAALENQFDPTATYRTNRYQILNANGGVSGRFSSVTNVNSPRNFLISTYYTPTTANVILTSPVDATLASSTSTSLLTSGQDYLTTIMNQVNGYQLGGLGLVASNHPDRARRNVWFEGVGFFNKVNADGVAPGYSANTGGGILGVDSYLGDSTRVGVAGGFTFTDLGVSNFAQSSADINSARVHLYGAHSLELVTLSAIGGYAHHGVDSERRLVGTGTASGSQSQHEASFNFQMTMNPRGDIHSFLPYLGLQWVHLSQSAYTEQGTPGFNMNFGNTNVDSLRPYVGARYQFRRPSPSGLLMVPYLFTRYSHETISDSNLSSLSINGTNFLVEGVRPNRNIVSLGGGFNGQVRQNLDWYANYGIDLGDRGTNQNASGGLGFKF